MRTTMIVVALAGLCGCGDALGPIGSVCDEYVREVGPVDEHAGQPVDALVDPLATATAVAETPEGPFVDLAVSFERGEGAALQVALDPGAPEGCAGQYPRLRVPGTWHVEMEDRWTASWEGYGSLGPEGQVLSGSAVGPDLGLPAPPSAPEGTEVHDVVFVDVRQTDGGAETRGYAEQAVVGDHSDASLRELASW